jgi:hypothetical protein
MPYGQIKVDEITFTNAGVDQTISVSGVVASISGNITATGTISGDVIRGGTLVSGATVTGTAGQFGTITGNAAGFTTVTGTTVTGTTAQFTTVTGGTAGFTTITGTTVTGTTANFVTVSGTTVTGNVGNFTTVTGGTVTLTSGVFAAGSATNPSISFTSDPNSGLFSPGADQVAISTNGTGRLFVDASGNVGVGGTGASTAATYGNFVIAKNRADLTGPHLVLGGFDTTAWNNNEEIGAIDFWNNDAGTSGVASQIRSIRTGTLGEGGLLTFSTRESGVSTLNERMRLDSSGRLGLGTTSPAHQLVVGQNAWIGTGGGESTGAGTPRTLTIAANRSATDVSPSLQLLKGYTSASATVGGFKLDLANTSVGAPELAFYSGTSIGNTAASFVEPTWTERARIDSTGRLGLGTSTPNSPFEVGTLGINLDGAIAALPSSGADSAAFIARTASTGSAPFDQAGSIIYRPRVSATAGRSSHIFYTGSPSAIRMVINEAGNVGIGVTGPQALLHCETTGQELARFNSSNVNGGYLSVQSSGTNVIYIGSAATLSSGTSTQGTVRTQSDLLFATGGGSERARIDSSGRLLIGTSTSPTQPQGQYAILVAQGYAGVPTAEGIVSIQRGQGAASITSGADIGRLVFGDSAGNTFAGMYCYADANAGSGDYPGRLSFSTCADGASSPTERMRIGNDGKVYVGKTAENFAVAGVTFRPAGQLAATCSNDFPIEINRINSDGGLVRFYQDGTEEGNISVSGTTVSYNGAHLSRWSQLPGGTERSEILRGTVLSNIDEMCGWGDEDNEQLNRMKVSDMEGDPNVAGVFQAWDDDDDTYTDDFYCAMTGDFIIRIAEGVTVQRGDLLMSAGDGTAKPQDDDIIRSKTIAKVTSTHVTCTYDDGSYCVPCVLMAC